MRLERAEQFSDRTMATKQAQSVKALFEANPACCECGAPSETRFQDKFYCARDGRIARYVAERRVRR